MNLLSEAFNTLLDPRDPRSQSDQYQNRLKALSNRIDNLPVRQRLTDTDAAASAEIYQIVTQIYVARASQSPWEPSEHLEGLVDKAFAVPERGHYCEHFFPMLILACEARTDERRVAILDLFERNQRAARGRSMEGLKHAIQAIWVQQDLHADDDLLPNYLGILSAAINTSNTLPSFV